MQLSLFFDILTAMTTELDRSGYEEGVFKQNSPEIRRSLKIAVETKSSVSLAVMKRARVKLWDTLRGTRMSAG